MAVSSVGSVSFDLPHIVDVNWRLDYYMKNSCVEKVNEASYLISLLTQVQARSTMGESNPAKIRFCYKETHEKARAC